MLVLPVIGSADRRKMPLLTIGLIAVNCIIYFCFQGSDNERYYKALEYYMSSGLERIELEAYIHYLRAGTPPADAPPDAENMNDEQHMRCLHRMMQDTAFQAKLVRREIITPGHAQYARWTELRTAYGARLDSVVSWRYGFRPASHRPATFLTHMFLHGGVAHLLGNMLVLWLVGCMVELGSGRRWFAGIYLPGGLASVCLFWLVYPQSLTPLVGASGAIAAVMGACAVLYGTKKIKVFYSLGFYFGYRQVYGFALLPFWLANELYQLFFGALSNVAYVAHIGGLIGGGLLGLACRRMHGTQEAEELFREEPADETAPLIEQAMEKTGRLDLRGARELLEQVLKKDPGHMKALQQLFVLERHEPRGPQFHRAAERLLGRLCEGSDTQDQACRVYEDYCAAAKPQRLSGGLFVRVGMAYISTGRPEVAEKLLSALIRHRPEAAGLPQALLKLADALRKRRQPDRAAACLKALAAKFPDSPAGRIAATALAAQKAQGPTG